MNFFSALNDSDDEPTPKRPQKPKAAPTSKTAKNDDATRSAIEKADGRIRGAGPGRGKPRERRPPSKVDGSGNPRTRQYDRRSGTGRGKESSKSGRGSFGWGNDEDDAAAAEKGDLPDDVVDGAEEVDSEPVPEPEPEVPTFTLDEYMAKKKSVGGNNSELFSAQKTRSVETSFAGLSTGKDELTDFLKLGEDKKQRAKTSGRAAKKETLSLAFKSAPKDGDERPPRRDDDRRRNDRQGREGGRGGGRGDRPSGRGSRNEGRGGRGGGSGSRAPGGGRGGGKSNVLDLEAFPAL